MGSKKLSTHTTTYPYAQENQRHLGIGCTVISIEFSSKSPKLQTTLANTVYRKAKSLANPPPSYQYPALWSLQ
jgi:hypothetical protein